LSQTPKPDPAKAVESYRKAADRGYAPAQAQLGYMMKYGQGIPKDAKGGFAWFLKAARQGNAFAERELGLSYLFGDGVPKSDKDAFAWLYSAAVQDDSTAEHNLGYLYRTGRGVTRNYKAAYAWYYRSAEHNDHYGEWGLAYMYQRGHGVKKDVTEAMKWYRKAEVGLPKNESLKRVIALTDLQAFLESPTSKTLNISALRSAFFWPLVIGLYLFAAIYVAIGVILLCYSLRKPYAPGILVALGWIVFYFESQGVATLAVMIAGNSLLADVLIGSIAVFGAVPVIGSTLGASRSRVWKSSPLPWRTLLAYASALCLALIALGFIHEKVSSLISHSPLPPQSTMALFEKSKEASAWVTFACVALVIPIAEEVLFRSYLFDALRRHLPGSATIFITAFLFAFVHFQLLYFLPLFVMGLVFGLARLKTDSLRPSILLHVLNNAVVLAAFH
jgi:membrane protease YdiL (CAAX protease family)